jgi:hypothetical protein
MPRRFCEWSEIEPGSEIYNTCREGEEFHLTPGLDLYPYCMWCGGTIKVVERFRMLPLHDDDDGHNALREECFAPTKCRHGTPTDRQCADCALSEDDFTLQRETK